MEVGFFAHFFGLIIKNHKSSQTTAKSAGYRVNNHKKLKFLEKKPLTKRLRSLWCAPRFKTGSVSVQTAATNQHRQPLALWERRFQLALGPDESLTPGARTCRWQFLTVYTASPPGDMPPEGKPPVVVKDYETHPDTDGPDLGDACIVRVRRHVRTKSRCRCASR